ncbi:uncharacterized BrkB/YihY/UPF0761 family membrane protein [Paraburkholderia youngii]
MSAPQPKTAARPARWRHTINVASDAASRFLSDRCAMLGASIAFYSAFSLAPTLLLVLAVIGWIFGRDAAQGRLFEQARQLVGNDAAHAMQDIVAHAHYAGGSGVAAAFSIALLLVGASATFSSLNTALDIVFAAHPRKGIAGLALLVRARLVSIGLLIGLSFLLVVSLVVDAAIQTLGGALFGNSALGIVADVLQSLLGFVILAVGLGALIKWLPDAAVPLRPALVGGNREPAVHGGPASVQLLSRACGHGGRVRRGRLARGADDVAVLLRGGVPVRRGSHRVAVPGCGLRRSSRASASMKPFRAQNGIPINSIKIGSRKIQINITKTPPINRQLHLPDISSA